MQPVLTLVLCLSAVLLLSSARHIPRKMLNMPLLSDLMSPVKGFKETTVSITTKDETPLKVVSVTSTNVRALAHESALFSMAEIEDETPTFVNIIISVSDASSFKFATLSISFSDGSNFDSMSYWADSLIEVCPLNEENEHVCQADGMTLHRLEGLRLPKASDLPAWALNRKVNTAIQLVSDKNVTLLETHFFSEVISRD